ncbi:MAG: adenylosuccinate lyase, partial [Planctomycetota bacterium]|nr:adenylosuccinate lyase [Planctomycetota bacterium]
HSVACANGVKNENQPNELMERIKSDPNFAKVNLERQVNPLDFVGRSREQVDQFCESIVTPIKEQYGVSAEQADLRV